MNRTVFLVCLAGLVVFLGALGAAALYYYPPKPLCPACPDCPDCPKPCCPDGKCPDARKSAPIVIPSGNLFWVRYVGDNTRMALFAQGNRFFGQVGEWRFATSTYHALEAGGTFAAASPCPTTPPPKPPLRRRVGEDTF